MPFSMDSNSARDIFGEFVGSGLGDGEGVEGASVSGAFVKAGADAEGAALVGAAEGEGEELGAGSFSFVSAPIVPMTKSTTTTQNHHLFVIGFFGLFNLHFLSLFIILKK